MKTIKRLILGIMLLGGSIGTGAAQQNIIVFDADAALAQSEAGQNLGKQIAARERKLQSEGEKTNAELKNDSDKLQEQRSLLAPAALQARLRELQAKQVLKQQEFQRKVQALQQGRNNSVNIIAKIMNEEVMQIAKNRKASLVLYRQAAAYIEPQADITAELVARLNKRVKRVRLKIPPIAQE